jgi:DNA-directed DNA polymerase III PolC
MSKFKQLISPHNHSHYSLDGAATVEDMVLHLKGQGSPYAALTEHGNLASSLELYDKCKKHHIKPILGIELYIEPPFLLELRKPIEAEIDASKKYDSADDREIAIQKALRNEYAHLTVHFKDEWAYEYFCKLTPKMESRALVKWGERKPIATLDEVAGAAGHITACSSCFLPGTKVHTEYGLKNIEEIQSGEKVYNRFGAIDTVITPTSRIYSGKMVKLKIRGSSLPIHCTEDHKFLTTKGFGKTEWVPAKDLTTLDEVLFIASQDTEDTDIWSYTYTSKLQKTIITIPLNAESMWCIGLFLAEGSWSSVRSGRRDTFNISLHKDETAMADRFCQWALSLGAVSAKYFFVKNTNGLKVQVNGVVLTEALIHLFGGHAIADSKKIPRIIKRLPLSKLRHLFRGYADGDGCYQTTKFNHRNSGQTKSIKITLASVSQQLAQDMCDILRRADIDYNTSYIAPKITKSGSKKKAAHYIYINGIREVNRTWEWTEGNLHLDNLSPIPKRVSSKETYEYSGRVHCLSVQSDPSFAVEGGAIVHNCLVGICGKFLLPRRKSGWSSPELAEKAYMMLRDIVGKDNFFVEVFPHEVNKTWKRPDKKTGARGFFEPHECTPYAINGDIQKPVNDFVMRMAHKNNDRIIVSLDAHFARPEQEATQIARLGNGEEAWRFSNTYNLMSSDEAYAYLTKIHNIDEKTMHQWIDNSYAWASNFDSFNMKTKKERVVLSALKDTWQDDLLKIIDSNGRMNWNDPIMLERLRREIDTITGSGINLMPYFFTVHDMVDWARKNKILVSPRGSGGGSLLLFLMGISGTNPLKYGLSFERFLTPGRIKGGNLPDIDLDFSDQTSVFEHLAEKYGDAFCNIAIDTQLKLKSSIKDAERCVLGTVKEETERLCKTLPQSPQGSNEHDYVFGSEDDHGHHTPGVFDEHPGLRAYANNNPEIWGMVKEMLGINRQRSSHPCGVVIADQPVQNYMPISYVKTTRVTGFSPKMVEEAGLIKYDILGVNTLRDIQGSLQLIKDRHGIDLDIYNLPDDPRVWQMFQEGKTETVFQFDTPTIRPFLRTTYPNSIEDLTALTSLGRPGTLDAPESEESTRTLADVYVARRNGEPIRYLHPDLEPILKETSGIFLYQEQQMQVFKDVAGYSDAEADEVRRAIGKKDKRLLEKQTSELGARILLKGTWSEDQVNLLIKQIMASANYGFNKSHALAYAVIAYCNAYLKLNFSLEWWTAILKNASKDDLKRYWTSTQDLIRMPSINQSTETFNIVSISGKEYIQSPITLLDGVGAAITAEVSEKRPFRDFTDFVTRVDRRIINKKAVHKFILSGLLDELFPDNTTDLEKITQYYKFRQELDGGKNEAIPEELINLSPLQKLRHKRDIFTVYKIDWTETAIPYLESNGLIKKLNYTYMYSDPNRKDLDGRPLYNSEAFKNLLNPKNKAEYTVAVVGYVSETKQIEYGRKGATNPDGSSVKNTMMRFLLEVGESSAEIIKWPDWGSNSHGIEKDLSEKVCLVVLNRKNSDRGIQLTIKKIIDISTIDI